ncbi:MAG: NapC/NirT family cytochrome c [Gammaproteobacteria bacterium]|nr:NapC/NirT family cytochrome c [Gammaproteobacteria bacterium]
MPGEKNQQYTSALGKYLWQRPNVWWLIGVPVGGLLMFVIGIMCWTGFNLILDETNKLEFCTSCHEMEQVFKEYKTTVHYKNPSGVRAICSDCHVPRPWLYKVRRKIQASNEVLHKLLGSIDTPEKFNKKRLQLAENVWRTMKQTDSRECRNCHSFDTMKLEDQDRSAQKRHSPERRTEKDETCIDCHKGIAHELPEDYDGE